MRSAQKEAERQREVNGKLAIAASLRQRTSLQQRTKLENPIEQLFDVENVESHQSFEDEK